jgi:hypothetical protein
MAGAKPWQIVVIVAAIVMVIGSAVYMFSGRQTVNTANELMLVDVGSGDLFIASLRKRGIALPAAHPDTQQPTLVPVSQDEEGRWVVSRRDIGALKNLNVNTSAFVDERTGEVRVNEGTRRKLP